MSAIIQIRPSTGTSGSGGYTAPLPGSVPWTLMNLQNDWVKWTDLAGYATPSFRKHPNGIVELKGMIRKTSGAPILQETICTLPLSCRPSEGIFVIAIGQLPDNTDILSSFLVQPNGLVQWRSGGYKFLSFPTTTYGVDKPTAVFFGDSNTVGAGVSATQRWSYLVSQSVSAQENNQGINGTLLQNTNSATQPFGNNGRDTYGTRIVSEYGDLVFILYGLNDLRWNGGSTVALFQSQLDFIVGDLIKKNIAPSNIFVGDIPYINPSAYSDGSPWNGGNVTKHYEYNSAVLTVAQKYKVKFASVYNRMLNTGNNSLLQADGFHPNATGHQAIANAFLEAKIPF